MHKTGMTRSFVAICWISLSALGVNAQPDEFAVTNEPPAVSATTNAPATEPTESCKLERPDYWPITLTGEIGTTCAGGNASWRFADHLGLRAGGNYFAYSYSGDIEDIRYNSDVRMMSEHLSLD